MRWLGAQVRGMGGWQCVDGLSRQGHEATCYGDLVGRRKKEGPKFLLAFSCSARQLLGEHGRV